MSNLSADAVFDALGEPVRRRILELLREGPTPVGRLAERLPGAGRFAAATRLATEDDASVAGGFFTVTVRPWQVMMGAD